MTVASAGALHVVNPATLEFVATVPTTEPAHVQSRGRDLWTERAAVGSLLRRGER